MIDLDIGQACCYTTYFGPATEAVRYFERCGHPCPESFNPADFYLDILSPDTRTEEDDKASNDRILELASRWSDEGGAMIAASEKSRPMSTLPIREVGDSVYNFQRAVTNFSLLLWRSWAESTRELTPFKVKIGFSVIFGLIIGGIYSSTGNNQKAIVNKIGILYFVLINQCFNSFISVLNTFPKEKLIVNRYSKQIDIFFLFNL